MSLPQVPENLENIAVVREFLANWRVAIQAAIDAGGGGGGGSGDIKSDGSVPFAADESMGGFKLTNVGTPGTGGDATNKTYVDNLEALDLRKDGSRAMTGALNMGTHLINNVVDPVAAQDAMTKNYFDVHDRFAATRIVDPTGVAGTDTTLASAITNLPAEGGLIFMKQGTYTISSTQTLPAKNIIIVGAGVDSTIINFTGTGTFLSQANGGVYFAMRDLLVDGGALNTGQKFFVAAGPTELEAYFESMEIEGFNHIIEDIGGSDNTFTFISTEMHLPAFDLTSSFYRGVSSGTVIWNYTSVTLTEASRLSAAGGAFLGSPKWVVDHSYIGGPPPSAISDFVIGQAIFDGMRADKIKFIISGAKSQIYGFEGIDAVVNCSGDDFFLSHSHFIRAAGIGSENQFVTMSGNEAHISDCTFNGIGSVTNCLVFNDTINISVVGCRFKNFTFTTIFLDAAAVGTISSNIFSNAGTPVTESHASAAMEYVDNTGFTGSSIAGADSVVNGVRRKDLVGVSTTNTLTIQFSHANTKGMTGVGSLKNTGGSNTMVLRLSVTDAFGVSDTQDVDVLPGAAVTWSMTDAVGTALAPFVNFTVLVQSKTAGLHTTFTLHHASAGAY